MRTLSIANGPPGYEVVFKDNEGAVRTIGVLLWALVVFESHDMQTYGKSIGEEILPVIFNEESEKPKIVTNVGAPNSRYLALQPKGASLARWVEESATSKEDPAADG